MGVKLFILLAIIFSSCTKFGKNVTVKGRVVNPITGEGIPDIRVFMYKVTMTSLPADYKIVKEVNTGSDGSFELNKLGLSKYYVKCDIPGDYYILGWEQNDGISLFDKHTLSVKRGKTMSADFYAVPYGQLHWHIQNINCEGSTDTMWYKIKYQYDDDFLSLWSFPITGCADINGNGSDKMEMGNHIIYMRIKRPSGTIYKYDTVFVNENGVTNYDLFY